MDKTPMSNAPYPEPSGEEMRLVGIYLYAGVSSGSVTIPDRVKAINSVSKWLLDLAAAKGVTLDEY